MHDRSSRKKAKPGTRHGPMLMHLLHRASQLADEVFVEECGQLEITPRQFIVLAAIGASEGANQTAITEQTGIDRSTMSELASRLVSKGLLQRNRLRNDARAYALRLTKEGTAKLQEALASVAGVEARCLAGLSAAERQALLAGLGAMVTSAGAKPGKR